MIKIKELKAGYGNVTVLKDLDLDFRQGSITALLGPNGAGKSTLLRCLCGDLVPQSGDIKLAGKSISCYRRRELAKQVAIIPQNFSLQFEYEVRELIMMGRFPYLGYLGSYTVRDHEIVDEILEILDLTEFSTKNFSELSGGEQQRVAIARALAQQTPVLLLDEAFANLDINHSISIMKLLLEIKNSLDKTVILVSHNINLAVEFCSSAVLMQKGRIIRTGSSSEVITEENLSAVYEHPLKVITNPVSGKPNLVYTP